MKRGKKRKESYSSCQVTTAHPPVSCCITIILAFKQPFYLLFSKYLGFALPAMNCLYALICILNKRLPLQRCWLQSPLLFIPYFVFYRFHLTILFFFFVFFLLLVGFQAAAAVVNAKNVVGADRRLASRVTRGSRDFY